MHSDGDLRARILEMLSTHHTMALATIRPDGFPQTTTLNYINEDLHLFFATDAAAQKVGNIELNNKVSAAITSQTRDFTKLAGLSMSGIATRIKDKDEARLVALSLFETMPQHRRYVPENLQQIAVYRINPVAISIIDFAKGFGSSALLEL